tara:strand:+ start:583 stop:1206 length:624 start_codon:yes stop_codon:yes gene_type:complete
MKFIELKKIYIFDLDGVLIDSKKNMSISWNAVRKILNIETKFINYFGEIGIPFKEILKKLKINRNKHIKAEIIFKSTSKKNFDSIKLYPKVLDTIKKLRNEKKIIGILTSKDKIRTKMILNHFNIKVDFILCPESKKYSKPNPFQILRVIDKFKVKKKEVVFFGDTNLDKITAKRAKVDFVYCKYGYGNLNNYKKFVISRFSQVSKL